MEKGLSFQGDDKRHALVGGGQRLHGDAGDGGYRLAAAQAEAAPRRVVGEVPPGAVALREADVLSQQEADVPPALRQGENGGIEVVFMAVAGKDQQRPVRRKGRQFPLPPVKEQARRLQLQEEAAVGEKCDAHQQNFTAVP